MRNGMNELVRHSLVLPAMVGELTAPLGVRGPAFADTNDRPFACATCGKAFARQ